MPPEHYRQLPKGIRCRCLKLWREADGNYWCCNPSHLEQAESVSNKITSTPDDDALNAFDATNNVEPFRTTAYRIAAKYGHSPTGRLVDEISHALEDAYNLGERRGPFVAALRRT